MESAAIDKIRDLTLLASAISDTFIPARVVPKDCSVESLERFLDAPARFRGTFSTQFVEDWAAYVLSIDNESAPVFINLDDLSAAAIFDYGTTDAPAWREHKAKLKLVPSPEYAALCAANGSRFAQRTLIEWIEDWQHAITARADNSDAALTAKNVIQRLRRVSVDNDRKATHETADYRASASALEAIEIKADAGQQLPTRLFFECEPYSSLSKRVIAVRISAVLEPGKAPAFILRIIAHDLLKRQFGEELADRIKEATTDRNPVFIGTFA